MLRERWKHEFGLELRSPPRRCRAYAKGLQRRSPPQRSSGLRRPAELGPGQDRKPRPGPSGDSPESSERDSGPNSRRRSRQLFVWWSCIPLSRVDFFGADSTLRSWSTLREDSLHQGLIRALAYVPAPAKANNHRNVSLRGEAIASKFRRIIWASLGSPLCEHGKNRLP